MKSEYALLLLGVTLLGSVSRANAAEAPASPAPAAASSERANAAAANYMQRLLAMSDEQLVRSRQVIEKVEKLSHEERAVLRKRLLDLREAPVAEREKLAAEMLVRFGLSAQEFRGGRENRATTHPATPSTATPSPAPVATAPATAPRKTETPERSAQDTARRNGFRSLLDKHWATLSPDEAAKDRERFVAMTREQRVEYAKKLREQYGLPPEPERRRPAEGAPAHPAPAPKTEAK